MNDDSEMIRLILQREQRQTEKLAVLMKKRRQKLRIRMIPPNPFVDTMAKPDLAEFQVDDEWLQDALEFQIRKQFNRDGIRHLAFEKMIQTGCSLKKAWEGAMTAATAKYSRSELAVPYSSTEKVAEVFYFKRYAPTKSEAECNLSRNERKWYIGISLNRNRNGASLINWSRKVFIPFALSAIRWMANIEMQQGVLFSEKDANRLRKTLGSAAGDENFNFLIDSGDLLNPFKVEEKPSQRMSRTKLRGRLLAIACYRYVQAGYGWESYDRDQNALGLEAGKMSRERFRQRLRIAVGTLREEWSSNLVSRPERTVGIHFPLGRSFPVKV